MYIYWRKYWWNDVVFLVFFSDGIIRGFIRSETYHCLFGNYLKSLLDNDFVQSAKDFYIYRFWSFLSCLVSKETYNDTSVQQKTDSAV